MVPLCVCVCVCVCVSLSVCVSVSLSLSLSLSLALSLSLSLSLCCRRTQGYQTAIQFCMLRLLLFLPNWNLAVYLQARQKKEWVG